MYFQFYGQLVQRKITPDSTTIYEYDALGRVTRVIDQETGFITQSHYDTLIGEDPDPGIADNLIGQLTGRTLIIDENTSYTTSYTYYADGKTKSMTDANGNTWFYEYTIYHIALVWERALICLKCLITRFIGHFKALVCSYEGAL